MGVLEDRGFRNFTSCNVGVTWVGEGSSQPCGPPVGWAGSQSLGPLVGPLLASVGAGALGSRPTTSPLFTPSSYFLCFEGSYNEFSQIEWDDDFWNDYVCVIRPVQLMMSHLPRDIYKASTSIIISRCVEFPLHQDPWDANTHVGVSVDVGNSTRIILRGKPHEPRTLPWLSYRIPIFHAGLEATDEVLK